MIVVKKMSRSCERRGLWSAVMMALNIVLCKRKGKKGQWVYEGVWREGLLDRRFRKGWWKKKGNTQNPTRKKRRGKVYYGFWSYGRKCLFFHFWSHVLGFSFFLFFFVVSMFFSLCSFLWFFVFSLVNFFSVYLIFFIAFICLSSYVFLIFYLLISSSHSSFGKGLKFLYLFCSLFLSLLIILLPNLIIVFQFSFFSHFVLKICWK